MSLDHAAPAAPAAGGGLAGSPNHDGDEGDDDLPGSRPGSRRRRWVAGVAVLAGVATAAAVLTRGDGGGEAEDAATTATTTVPVEVRDLVVTDDYEGELGYGETDSIASGRSGVVTGTPAVGATVTQGQAVFHVDLQPTVLLHGEVPAFRDLSVDADPGADVAQLEQALVDLGFGAGVTVDDSFTEQTADAVTDWEESLGRSDPDGVVSLGDVVFAPGDLRVAEVSADRGTQVQSGTAVLDATSTTKVVTLGLTVDQVANVEAGAAVDVTLPDGSETTGTITDIATEPSSDDEGDGEGSTGTEMPTDGSSGDDTEETYPVTITLDDPAAAAELDTGGVDVTLERSRTDGATAVPVTALLALSEGGYALQVVDGSQPSGYRLVAVEVGTIADEWAEVTGDGIDAGVEVVMPA